MSNESNGSNNNGPIVPDGRYKVRAVDAAFGYAGKNDTEQIGIQVEIVDGPHAGTLLTYYGFLTEAAEEITINAMRALGWQGVDITKLDTMFTGTVALATVEAETYNGKTRTKVQWINKLGVVMNKEMDAAARAKLAQRIRGVAARIGGGSTSTTSKPPGAGSAPPAARNTRPAAPPPEDDSWMDDAPPPSDADAPPQRSFGNRARG